MELPDLGEQCSLKECRRLDFLPIKCSSCKQIFCSNHFLFDAHNCPSRENDGDNQVPICPLCNKPVPIGPGESADYRVSEHIDQNCMIHREKVFKNRCQFSGCKKRELMPLRCDQCGNNHCLVHRHPKDHDCTGRMADRDSTNRIRDDNRTGNRFLEAFNRRKAGQLWSNMTNAFNSPTASAATTTTSGSAATQRATPTPTSVTSLQGDLTEEEALNIAIAESLSQNQSSSTTTKIDASNRERQKCRLS